MSGFLAGLKEKRSESEGFNFLGPKSKSAAPEAASAAASADTQAQEPQAVLPTARRKKKQGITATAKTVKSPTLLGG